MYFVIRLDLLSDVAVDNFWLFVDKCDKIVDNSGAIVDKW